MLVFPTSGKALSLDQVEIRNRTLPDGTVSTETTHRKIYRDVVGRIRTEGATSRTIDRQSTDVTVIDPVGRFMAVMMETTKSAIRLELPGSQSLRFGNTLPGFSSLPAGDWITDTENAGTRTIEGMEFEGTRFINTSREQPSLKLISEFWSSSALGLIGLAVATSPQETHTIKIDHVIWQDPDPALFIVPPGYAVHHMTMPG